MPTPEHHTLVERFRENPDLAPDFLTNLFGLAVPPYASVRVADAPHAGLVVELCDEGGARVLSIVFEA